jgi:glutamyl-tRNA synthetase
VRFKVPDKKYFINDMVRGRVVWNPQAALGDFIIMRSNGMPVYNFCVAIDDYLMKISHVIRAEEHLSNTIKQILIFNAMEAKHPEYAHCSLILGADKTKLSKRHGAASLSEFEAKGYFPSAMRNYLAMLGWNSGTTKEIYTDSDLVEAFDVNRVVKSPAVFDTTRLNWINAQHIALLPQSEFLKRCEGVLRNSSLFPLLPNNSTEEVSEEVALLEKEFIGIASNLGKGSMKFIDDVIPLTKTILRYPFSESQQEKKGIKAVANDNFVPIAYNLLSDFKEGKFPRPTLDPGQEEYDPAVFGNYLNTTADVVGILRKQVFFPSRLLLTGSLSGPEIGSQLRLLEITSALLDKGPRRMGADVEFTSLDKRMEALEAYLQSRED